MDTLLAQNSLSFASKASLATFLFISKHLDTRCGIQQKGYVDIRVSARAYQELGEVKSIVEFQYKQVRSEKPLAAVVKCVALFCGLAFPVGLLPFPVVLANYKNNGYTRMAKQFRNYLLIGIACCVVLVVLLTALDSRLKR
jgi:hypothetical protein